MARPSIRDPLALELLPGHHVSATASVEVAVTGARAGSGRSPCTARPRLQGHALGTLPEGQ
eukprot:193598-Rhodomonas_salina.1